MIVAQSLAEVISIISKDKAFASYSVNVSWQDDVKPDDGWQQVGALSRH